MKENSINCEKIKQLVSAAFQAMLDNTSDMMFVKDANSVYVAASLPFVKMVGKETVDEIINRTDLEIFEDKNLARRYIADDKKLIAEGENLVDYMEPITDDNGQARYGSTSKYLLSDASGEIIGILGITRDITREYIARQHYQHELKYLFELPEDTYAVTYIDVDSWRIISQRKQRIGEDSVQACQTVDEICEAALNYIVDRESEAAVFYRNFFPAYLWSIYTRGKNAFSYKYQCRMLNGQIRWVQDDVKFLTDVDSGHLCVMLSAKDIDAQKQKEKELIVSAKMDKMTMVLNRETTMENINKVLVDEADSHHVLFMIDVDNFKTLNDTLGHQRGDAFLVAFAAEIQKCFRESDIVGRIGGDEFFALMRNIPDAAAVMRKAQELLSSVQNVCAGYASVQPSASIGISVYPENGKTLEELYAQADSALYQAKREGKNRFVFAQLSK